MVEPPAFADFQQVYVMRGNVRLLGNGFQVETQAASGSLQRTSERMLGVFHNVRFGQSAAVHDGDS